MNAIKFGLALAAREHLASGQPITRLEAMVLYGVANLPDVVKGMRHDGWVIESRLDSLCDSGETSEQTCRASTAPRTCLYAKFN